MIKPKKHILLLKGYAVGTYKRRDDGSNIVEHEI